MLCWYQHLTVIIVFILCILYYTPPQMITNVPDIITLLDGDCYFCLVDEKTEV